MTEDAQRFIRVTKVLLGVTIIALTLIAVACLLSADRDPITRKLNIASEQKMFLVGAVAITLMTNMVRIVILLRVVTRERRKELDQLFGVGESVPRNEDEKRA